MAMYLKNCIDCGKLFEGGEDQMVCPPCVEKNRDDFDKVRKYLHTHGDVTFKECMENTGVPQRTIQIFLKQNRLKIIG